MPGRDDWYLIYYLSSMENALSAFLWPLQSQAALGSFAENKIVVIHHKTPKNMPRDAARQHVRLAITEFLLAALPCPADQLRITSVVGEGLFVSLGANELYVSTSYEAEIAVAAISCIGPIGIDIMSNAPQTGWEDIATLYLGEQKTSELQQTPLHLQATKFAHSWTQLEAKFKCAGLALTEYEHQKIPLFINRFSDIQLYTVSVPVQYIASLALRVTSSENLKTQ